MNPVRLAADGDAVTVDVEAGGRVVSAVLGGAERLVTAPPSQAPPGLAGLQWGMYVMAPWAGRIAGGRLWWDGRVHQLPTTDEGHALHGLVHSVPWERLEATDTRIVLACDLAAVGWPFGGRVRHELILDPGRLVCRLEVRSGTHGMPAWMGWHPCFRRPEAGGLRLQVDADDVLATEGMIPTGEREPVAADTDLRDGPWLGRRRLDHAYVDPTSPAVLTWPDLALRVGFDEPTRCVVVFTPAHEVGVEPQSGWPDALSLAQRGVPDTGVRDLAPGEVLTTTMTWSWTAGAVPGAAHHAEGGDHGANYTRP